MFFVLPHTVGGEYNAVWDEKLSLCYALVQCKCGSVVGVKIHAVQGTARLEALVGKVSQICSNKVISGLYGGSLQSSYSSLIERI